MLVLYDYDSNAILTEPIKNRSGGEILKAYTKLHTYLTTRGFKPNTHWLDNEASPALKTFNRTHHVDFQLAPPHMHRRNAAERAIRTWKNHFVAGLCSTGEKFPLHLWDRLLEQATITLNLLRPSRRNPNVSAYQILEGSFHFNRTPMAPPGTQVVIHEKPQQRKTWDPHGIDGWYLGPALDHYRCYRVFAVKTKAERITDTAEFFPKHTPVPYPTPTDVAVQATETLIRVLQNPIPSTKFAHIGHDQLTAIQTIADIFQRHASPRVPTKDTNQRKGSPTRPNTLPRVLPTTAPRKTIHRYPTRHIISQTQDEMNLIHQCEEILPTIHHWANAIIDPDTGASMEYRHLVKSPRHQKAWIRSFSNEIGRLAQGIGGREKGTNTIFFKAYDQIPADRPKDVTYGRICANYQLQKTEPNRTRLTVGGNLIDFPGDVSTPTADTTTVKLVINSTISTPNAKYLIGDIKNFYLGTPMARYEYM